MKYIKSLGVVLMLTLIGLFASISANAAYIVQHPITEVEAPGENSAYITFTGEPKSNMMSYLGGVEEGRYGELYSEPATFLGIEGRQVYKDNVFYMKFDPEFADPDDCAFAIIIDYWDYGGAGYFHIEYTPSDGSETKRISVLKMGDEKDPNDQSWHRMVTYIADGQFTGRYENGGDLRIYSGAYNTFAHVEVINLSRYAKDSIENYGVVNDSKAKLLNDNGFYEWDGTQEMLLQEYTREQALVDIVKVLAPDKVMKKTTTAYADVKPENQAYLAAAKKLGLIVEDVSPTQLGADQKITQEEMIRMFVAYVGKDATTPDIYKYAREIGIVLGDSMIFQMKKNANMDNFVSLIIAALTTEVDGKIALLEMIDSGVLDIAVVFKDSFCREVIERRPFKLEPHKVIDPTTGRTWYWIDLFGIRVEKGYMAQNQFAMDGKRFYFLDGNKRVYEYNMETHYCKFIDKGFDPYNYTIVTTKTNKLIYLNSKKQFIRMDCDTYEKEVVAEAPPAGYTGSFSLFHITDDGRYMTIEGRDSTLDTTKYTRFTVLDLETGEWDSHWYHGFDTPMYYPDHVMINPINPRYLIFVHDTDAAARERIWILDRETGERWNAVHQEKVYPYNDMSRGYFGLGHESWCHDGEYIFSQAGSYWINSGLTVGYSTGQYKAGYQFDRMDNKDRIFVPITLSQGSNHPCVSWNSNRWIGGDGPANGTDQMIKMADAFSGINYQLLTAPPVTQNPCHAHPAFSWDDKTLMFGITHPDGPASYSCIAWTDVSDITQNPVAGGKYPLGNNIETFTYETTVNFFRVEEDKDGTYYNVPNEKQLPILVMPDYIDAPNQDVSIKITYKDEGINPMVLTYYTFKNIGGINRPEEHYVEIPRNNTDKWVTTEIKLYGIGVDNQGDLGMDFVLRPTASSMKIRSVEVTRIGGDEVREGLTGNKIYTQADVDADTIEK